MLEPSFGGVNLEDISAPRCFEIEEELKRTMNIPVFHDDQHGTAIVALAGLLNAAKVVGKQFKDMTVVINGAGASATAVAKMIINNVGCKDLMLLDTKGIIYEGRKEGMNWAKEEMAKISNKNKKSGSLADALVGADIFLGLSQANIVTPEMIQKMAKDPIVFAMANPTPEIMPELAKAAGAKVIGTGRSDYPNQVNNVMGFPGIFRGAFDVRAKAINEEMKLAAANALAGLISDAELNADYVIPAPFDKRVVPAVAKAVAEAAIKSGVATKK